MPSSVILGMRYEPETCTLLIAFRGRRGTYRYFDVPVEEWVAFRASGSKGTYLNEIFKAKEYRYEKVIDAQLAAQNQHRDSDKDDQAKEQAKLLEWGEAWAFPRLRAK